MKIIATFPDGSKWFCESDTKVALRLFRKKVLELCSEDADSVEWSGDVEDTTDDKTCATCKHYAKYEKAHTLFCDTGEKVLAYGTCWGNLMAHPVTGESLRCWKWEREKEEEWCK